MGESSILADSENTDILRSSMGRKKEKSGEGFSVSGQVGESSILAEYRV